MIINVKSIEEIKSEFLIAVTQNTEYVIQSSQYPTPWVYKSINAEDFKSGVTFWKFHDPQEATESGHHIGRMMKEESFTL